MLLISNNWPLTVYVYFYCAHVFSKGLERVSTSHTHRLSDCHLRGSNLNYSDFDPWREVINCSLFRNLYTSTEKTMNVTVKLLTNHLKYLMFFVVVFFLFFFFWGGVYSVKCPFQDYFTHRDEPIDRWGETGVLRENHLTHPQAELVLSHMWPVRGSNLHKTQR